MSSNTPPPWTGITGISRAAMKDNAQINATQYNGNARPAELVVAQNTLDLYVGDNNGNLILLATPNGEVANLAVYDEGVLLTSTVSSFDFVGDGVAATLGASNKVTVTVPSTLSQLYNGAYYADGTTTLTASINSNTTLPIAVASTAAFPNSGYIRVGAEVIQYTGKTATTFTGITRGRAGSNGSTHSLGAPVGAAQVTAAGSVATIMIDTIVAQDGMSLNTATGEVTLQHSGRYNFQFSVQSECYGNNTDDTVVWFALNGNTINNTASYNSVPGTHGGQPGSAIITVNVFLDLSANDVISLKWTSLGGTTAITTVPPVNSTIPTSPGVIFTVNRIY